jgi:hypothetical protein
MKIKKKSGPPFRKSVPSEADVSTDEEHDRDLFERRKLVFWIAGQSRPDVGSIVQAQIERQ